jgi:hypothetical protein
LISHGHRLPEVLNYTLAQVRVFLRAIDRQQRQAMAWELTLMRMAACGTAAENHDLLQVLAR